MALCIAMVSMRAVITSPCECGKYDPPKMKDKPTPQHATPSSATSEAVATDGILKGIDDCLREFRYSRDWCAEAQLCLRLASDRISGRTP